MHPGIITVTALVVVIDRNDVPEWWGSRPAPGTLRLMPPLFGGAPSDQGTHDQWNGHHITDDLSGSTSVKAIGIRICQAVMVPGLLIILVECDVDLRSWEQSQ